MYTDSIIVDDEGRVYQSLIFVILDLCADTDYYTYQQNIPAVLFYLAQLHFLCGRAGTEAQQCVNISPVGPALSQRWADHQTVS